MLRITFVLAFDLREFGLVHSLIGFLHHIGKRAPFIRGGGTQRKTQWRFSTLGVLSREAFPDPSQRFRRGRGYSAAG
jgi:hypothetical protein